MTTEFRGEPTPDAPHGWDTYQCLEPGCPWSVTTPSRGGCQGTVSLHSLPLAYVAAIGAHATWHERDEVRAGAVTLRWDDEVADFVEVWRRNDG